MNILGMSRGARIEWIESSTDSYHPADFWCEIFTGSHFSIDYKNQIQELAVLGTRNSDSSLYKWSKWEKVNHQIQFPEILKNLTGNYEYINCEFIGNKLIEVQFRANPDFRYGNSIAIPVWADESIHESENLKYIEDFDYLRKGFYIDCAAT